MQTISAYLAVANVGASMEFLERTLGFARGVTLADNDGQFRYAEMRHGELIAVAPLQRPQRGDGRVRPGAGRVGVEDGRDHRRGR